MCIKLDKILDYKIKKSFKNHFYPYIQFVNDNPLLLVLILVVYLLDLQRYCWCKNSMLTGKLSV